MSFCESRSPKVFEITGLSLDFIPYLIRDGSDEFGIIRGSLKFNDHFD